MAQIKTFQRTVAALGGVRMFKRVNSSGLVKDVTIHWPSGCKGYVSVKVSHGPKQFCPRQGYLALSGTTEPYRDLNEPLLAGEPLWVEIKNGDSANSHKITVIVTVEGGEVED